MTGSSALLLAADSWGGVASMITIATELRGLGVETRIAAYSDFGEQVRATGCESIDLGVTLADSWAEQNAQRSGWARSPVRAWAAVRSSMTAQAPTIARRLADSARPGELIVSGTLTIALAMAVAELRGGRVVAMNPAPMTPSRLAQASLTPVTQRPSRLNAWVGLLGVRGAERLLRPAATAWRQALGLHPSSPRDYLTAINQMPTMYGVSPALMPADPAWPRQITVTGHLLGTDSSPAIPGGLDEFLAEHPGAVYIGFGSWGNAITSADLDTVCRALAMTNRPGILAGSPKRGVLPDVDVPVFAVGEVSHDWLFPRLAAVVHHGGSGTTHRAIRAGVPSMAVPIGFDQPYWGRRLAQLGAGAPPIPYRKLSPTRLARSIQQLTGDPQITIRAKQLGAVLNAEHGPTVAAGVIASLLNP